MAWRIEDAVIRGEIDNRTRGQVIGRIWFVGREEPVQLELAGNAWRDLAGRRLEFTNPTPKPADLGSFAQEQAGVIGDCTASRKVKVPDIPMDQIGAYYAAKKPWPWHWGNCLYLEWFSTINGRVVIESAAYRLTVGPDATWEMTPEEEEQQRRANAEALSGFMGRLVEAAAVTLDDGAFEPEEAFDEPEKPMTEEEAERMDEDSQRLVDRIHARLERAGDDADFERILEEELEKRRQERGEAPPTGEELERRQRWIEEMNEAVADEPLRDDELSDERELHPLVQQTRELAVRLMREPEERGWLTAEAGEEHPLVDLGAATAKAGAKLAGALMDRDWPPAVIFCAHTIVRLKRARGYLEDALRAVGDCREQQLAEAPWLEQVQRELNAAAQQCDALITELRALLADATE